MNTYVICVDDHRRILDFLRDYPMTLHTELDQIEILRKKLQIATIVPESQLSRDVVSMYSAVRMVDLEDRYFRNYTLVYPYNASDDCGRISLLSPLGAAMLGCRAGATIELSGPEANRSLAIREVLYQPEWDERNRLRAAHLASPN